MKPQRKRITVKVKARNWLGLWVTAMEIKTEKITPRIRRAVKEVWGASRLEVCRG